MNMEKEKYLPGYAQRREHLYMSANTLVVLTMLFNMAIGFISISFGLLSGSVALFGFGFGSFVNLIYEAAFWNMIQRSSEDNFIEINQLEKKMLKIAGNAFYVLSVCIAIISFINLIRSYAPHNAFSGIIISIISLLALYALFYYKINVGKKLSSDIILTEAVLTKISAYPAIILLISSAGFELSKIGIFDSAGTIIIGVLLFINGSNIIQKNQYL